MDKTIIEDASRKEIEYKALRFSRDITHNERMRMLKILDLVPNNAEMASLNHTQQMTLFRKYLKSVQAARQSSQSEPVISKAAYDGAREDLAIWKRRALEAEKKVATYDQRIVDIGVIAMTPIAAPQQAIPSGYVLMPIEPNDKVIRLFEGRPLDEMNPRRQQYILEQYRKMLDAGNPTALPTAPIESDKCIHT